MIFMMSNKNVLAFLGIYMALSFVIRCEISDIDPPPNICLCVAIRNCNVRNSACGEVIDQAPNNECYIYTGQKTECILSGNVVQFFETIYYEQSGWIFGSNLILGTGPECGISDECAQVSCQNGGLCYNTLSGPVCTCLPGYEGQFCELGSSILILRNDYAGSNSGFFNRSWAEYQHEFGSPDSLYWIGLERLHEISQGVCGIRFDLQDIDGQWHYAEYYFFQVSDSSTGYRIRILGYYGDAGDAMANSYLRRFSTYDVDNDASLNFNCARSYGGGFWYNSCGNARITTSSTSYDFQWYYNYTDWMKLNAAEVHLICPLILVLRNDFAGSNSGFFNRSWAEYQQGFGSQDSLYWIGLERLHEMTGSEPDKVFCKLRFDLQGIDGQWHYADYLFFLVNNSSTNYMLFIESYFGEEGYDAMAGSNEKPFSTYDADNDGDPNNNYASIIGGGFWFGGGAFITTSSTNEEFVWISSKACMYLNVVEVRSLCQRLPA